MVQLVCPACGEPLARSGGSYACAKGHNYDISKKGYVNLLMKNSARRFGDDKRMLKARADFLALGHYAPLAAEISRMAGRAVPEGGSLVDLGCGEGYYLKEIEKTVCCGELWGVDISKEAAAICARRALGCRVAVASAAALPFPDGVFDAATCVFAPVFKDEFARVIKAGGALLHAAPLEDHLISLKKAIYDEAYENKPQPDLGAPFEKICQKKLKYDFALERNVDVLNLFTMTPYYYKTGREQQRRAYGIDKIRLEARFKITLYKKASRP